MHDFVRKRGFHSMDKREKKHAMLLLAGLVLLLALVVGAVRLYESYNTSLVLNHEATLQEQQTLSQLIVQNSAAQQQVDELQQQLDAIQPQWDDLSSQVLQRENQVGEMQEKYGLLVDQEPPSASSETQDAS